MQGPMRIQGLHEEEEEEEEEEEKEQKVLRGTKTN